jgi:hypothetical protein
MSFAESKPHAERREAFGLSDIGFFSGGNSRIQLHMFVDHGSKQKSSSALPRNVVRPLV